MSIYGRWADAQVGGAMGSPTSQAAVPPKSATRRGDATAAPALEVSKDDTGLLNETTQTHGAVPSRS